jgi:ribosomal protein S18 acetylase RimI-like enzyme
MVNGWRRRRPRLDHALRIRAVRADEWRELRDLRLRALQHDPQSFGSTYAEEAADPDRNWIDWAAERSVGAEQRTFIAEAPDGWHGMAFTSLLDDGHAGLGGLWIDSRARRKGLATALVDAVVAWARERYAQAVVLSVAEDNRPAIAFFLSTGFVFTGEHRPLPSRPEVATLAMRHSVDGPASQQVEG